MLASLTQPSARQSYYVSEANGANEVFDSDFGLACLRAGPVGFAWPGSFLPWRRPTAQMGDLCSRWIGTRDLLLRGRNPYGPEVSHESQLAAAAVALAPVVEPAGPNAQPRRESPDADLGLLRPASDKIHDLIPHIMRHPTLGQSSPRLFLSGMCHQLSEAFVLGPDFLLQELDPLLLLLDLRAGRSFGWKAVSREMAL